MPAITAVDAWEVLDSRGDPTVRVRVEAGDATGTFTVPAGASTGSHEAVERRDGGDRYGGRGVRGAVRAAREDLAPVVQGRSVADQRGIDAALVAADGTDRLAALGANAVLGVSGAVAHAGAAARGQSLYGHLADCYGREPGRIPRPMVNILSGGLHAAGGVAVQDYLAVPLAATDYPDALETVWEVRNAVRERIRARGERPLVADEGGFAPALDAPESGFDLLVAGIEDAGREPGSEVGIAVDVAATHLQADGAYALDGDRLDRAGMCDRVAEWVADYPIVSVEDPLAEDDWAGWRELADRLPDGVQLLGDDLLVTDADRVDRAAERGAANAVLVKPNQAGTLSRAVEVVDRARERGIASVVSARSGETCDATIADLAVALDAGQLKVGSLARSERLAKYNRLLGIAHRDPARGFPDAGRLG